MPNFTKPFGKQYTATEANASMTRTGVSRIGGCRFESNKDGTLNFVGGDPLFEVSDSDSDSDNVAAAVETSTNDGSVPRDPSVAPTTPATGTEPEVRITPPNPLRRRRRQVVRPRPQVMALPPAAAAGRIAQITNHCWGKDGVGRPTANRMLRVAEFRVVYADGSHDWLFSRSISNVDMVQRYCEREGFKVGFKSSKTMTTAQKD